MIPWKVPPQYCCVPYGHGDVVDPFVSAKRSTTTSYMDLDLQSSGVPACAKFPSCVREAIQNNVEDSARTGKIVVGRHDCVEVVVGIIYCFCLLPRMTII